MAIKCIYCGEPIGPESQIGGITPRSCEECDYMERRELELEELAEECEQYEEEDEE